MRPGSWVLKELIASYAPVHVVGANVLWLCMCTRLHTHMQHYQNWGECDTLKYACYYLTVMSSLRNNVQLAIHQPLPPPEGRRGMFSLGRRLYTS